MNTYAKYTPNVFLAKCTETHVKGETILVTTKYGKENECNVHNLVHTKDGFYYYSVTRTDGYNMQERAKAKSERYEKWALSAQAKSDFFQKQAGKDSSFLSLCEPIKIGHHSENRHRKIIKQANDNMRKCIDASKKSDHHKDRSEYWESRANDINLSMPESVEYFEYKLEEVKMKHEGLKDGSIERSHSFSLTYAKKELNEVSKKFELAKRLWL